MTFSETFLVFLVILVVFLGVKFGFPKPCLCKRNDKYKVCLASALQHVKSLPSLSSVQCATPPSPRLTSLKPLLGICQQLTKWKKVDTSASQDMKLRYMFV